MQFCNFLSLWTKIVFGTIDIGLMSMSLKCFLFILQNKGGKIMKIWNWDKETWIGFLTLPETTVRNPLKTTSIRLVSAFQSRTLEHWRAIANLKNPIKEEKILKHTSFLGCTISYKVLTGRKLSGSIPSKFSYILKPHKVNAERKILKAVLLWGLKTHAHIDQIFWLSWVHF